MPHIDFRWPMVLWLLPLALLPFWALHRESLRFPHVAWLPQDALGRIVGWLKPLLVSLAIASLLLAIAGPGIDNGTVGRVGRGAEILLLIDRSRSMDERMLPDDWRTIDKVIIRHQTLSRGRPKGEVARELLTRFVTDRPDDRYSVMVFSASPLGVVPFTQRREVVRSAIAASGIGRGLSDTHVGRALQTALRQFEGRPFTGSRVILLVSDGGAPLTEEEQSTIREALVRNRVGLYWLYLRTLNSTDFVGTSGQPRSDADGSSNPDGSLSNAFNNNAWQLDTPEMRLHEFFKTVPDFRLYQTDSPEDVKEAVEDIGRRQNQPLYFEEPIPRRDLVVWVLGFALLCCLLTLLHRRFELKRWSGDAGKMVSGGDGQVNRGGATGMEISR